MISVAFKGNKLPNLSPTEAADRASRGDLVLVDVRESSKRTQARPANSRHIPLADLPTELSELPRDQTVAFICRSGGRSQKAARAAADHGLTAANVQGGLNAWTEADLPVDSGPEQNA